MKRFLTFVLAVTMLLTFPATASSSKTEAEVLAYLENFNLSYLNTSGQSISISIDLENLTPAMLSDISDAISEMGLDAYDAQLRAQLTPEQTLSLGNLNDGSEPLMPLDTSYYFYDLEEGDTKIERAWPVEVDMGKGGTASYHEVVGMTVTVTNGVFSDVKLPSFDFFYAASYLSFSNVVMDPFYNDSVAQVGVDYTLNKSIIQDNIPFHYTADCRAVLRVHKN